MCLSVQRAKILIVSSSTTLCMSFSSLDCSGAPFSTERFLKPIDEYKGRIQVIVYSTQDVQRWNGFGKDSTGRSKTIGFCKRCMLGDDIVIRQLVLSVR